MSDNKNCKSYQYNSIEALKRFVGNEISFRVWGNYELVGVLSMEHKNESEKLYLPFCGLVDATTVETKLN